MEYFRIPLNESANVTVSAKNTYFIHNIFKRVRAVNGKANEKEISFGIREWS